MCKLGDKTFKKNEKEIEMDMAREDAQVGKIRELIKHRNKERGERHRIHQKAPGPKRRKLEDETYVKGQEHQELPERQSQEKRKADKNTVPGPEAQPSTKRRKLVDIRTLLQAQIDKKAITRELQEPEPQQELTQEAPAQDQPGVYYGEEQIVETVNWEEIFHQHLEETRRLERERQEQVERAEKKEKSWEMLRECTAFLKEHEKKWKFDNDKPKLKKKKEYKNR
jgi:hypothetical protein